MAEGDTHTPMSTATAAKAAPASSKSRAQREAEEYLSRIKLKEIFQVGERLLSEIGLVLVY